MCVDFQIVSNLGASGCQEMYICLTSVKNVKKKIIKKKKKLKTHNVTKKKQLDFPVLW